MSQQQWYMAAAGAAVLILGIVWVVASGPRRKTIDLGKIIDEAAKGTSTLTAGVTEYINGVMHEKKELEAKEQAAKDTLEKVVRLHQEQLQLLKQAKGETDG